MFKVGDFVILHVNEKSSTPIKKEWVGCLCVITNMWYNPEELTRYKLKDFSNSGFDNFKNCSWCELDFEYAFETPTYKVGDVVKIREDLNLSFDDLPHNPGITKGMIDHKGKICIITREYNPCECMFYVKFNGEDREHDCVWSDNLFE